MYNILIVTGSRSEYGLLRPVIEEFSLRKNVCLKIVATGMHLSGEHGNTYQEIINDGFEIDYMIEMLMEPNSSSSITKSIGIGMIGFADYLKNSEVDLLVVLGDRFELCSIVIAALNERIPIAHLDGGETGSGTVDNMIRHAITKMSNLHFTTTKDYRNRVIQLGEDPNRVYWVGSAGLENIKRLDLLSQKELSDRLGLVVDHNTLLCTYHPLTLDVESSKVHIINLLKALDRIENIKIIFTKSNADFGGKAINNEIEKYCNSNPEKAKLFDSLGSLNYLSVLKHIKIVVGNSSSGICEACSLETYALDIGDRQKNRISADSVLSVSNEEEDIYQGLKKLLTLNEEFTYENPYYKEKTSANIVDICLENLKRKIEVEKDFFDLEEINEY